MPTMPKLPTFELPKLPFDLPTIDLSSFELPKLPFDLPTIDLSSFELPELPTWDLPSFDQLPELPTFEQVAGAARDAASIGVGLAAMAAERAQAAGAKVVELVTAGVEQARAAAAV